MVTVMNHLLISSSFLLFNSPQSSCYVLCVRESERERERERGREGEWNAIDSNIVIFQLVELASIHLFFHQFVSV